MRTNKKTNARMVLIDLDGTLLNSSKKIGNDDWKTLEKIGHEGIIRVFATGRTLYSALTVLNDLTPFDYLVFSSGAGIVNWKTKEIIYKTALNNEQITRIEKILRKLEVNFAIQNPIPENHKYYYCQAIKQNTDFEWRNKLYKEYAIALNGFYPIKQATQFLVILNNETDFETVKSKISGLKVIRATSPLDGKSIWLEIFPKNVSKAFGGKYLCEMLGISELDTLSIGNDYNDIDLLQWTGQSFVVDNSPEQIKNMFMQCVDNDSNPLTDVVSKINLGF